MAIERFAGAGMCLRIWGLARRKRGELAVKAELTRQICNRIKELGLTQVAAAERPGVLRIREVARAE